MSNARKIADLLDSSGDVKSTHLDNTSSDLVDDTSPQLGGNLDLNSNNITGTGTIPAPNLTGDLPAIDGSSLTGIEGVPSGIISMWSGAVSAIPSGWNLCDGNNGTPNLVGKFIKGGSTAGTTGGSGTTSSNGSHTHSTPNHSHSHSLSAGSHTLSTSQMPSHKHRIKINNGGYSCGSCCPEHFILQNKGLTNGSGSCYNNQVQFYSAPSVENTGSTSSHSHSLSGSISSGGSGTSGSGGTGNTSSNGSHAHTISAPKYIDVIVCSKD